MQFLIKWKADASAADIPVMTYAISAGPLTTTATRDAVQSALNRAAVVTVRDRHGLRLLEEVGVTREIQLTADPAFLREPQDASPRRTSTRTSTTRY